MKIKALLIGGIAASIMLTGAYAIYDGGGDRGKLLVDLLMRSMEKLHYQPQAIDDSFSETVFEEYLEKVDAYKLFYTQENVSNLSRFQSRIDDELQNGTFEFFELSYNIFDRQRDLVASYIDELTAKPFDFNRKEFYDGNVENDEFAQNDQALKDRWRKELKYRTLVRLAAAIERQEKAIEDGETDFDHKTELEMEAEAREKVRDNYIKYIERISKDDINDYRAEYLNAVANVYDPHTVYFPPKDKEAFDIEMSGKFEGIGASLRDEDGYVRVVEIIPGSASARQGDLQADDKIVRVTQDGKDPVDVVGMDLDDVVKMIRGPKGTKVILSVKKMDGSSQDIPIVRDVVVFEETYAKSAIIKDGDSQQGIGYIHLPKFYVDFDNRKARRAATDVAKEIEKLKAENVEGIILDLRFNGGGSLPDVIEMSGLFVDNGPILQVKYRGYKPQVLNDRDRGTLYDGKLIVMVNSYSASASEILAAAMQDYDRALIVGSMSTYGKGTVQTIVNLDDYVNGGSEIKPLGQIKLTTQKYYRINGDATQLKGVVPDIILPDEYNKIKVGEKDYEHSMAWDKIQPVNYETWDQPVSSQLDELRRLSSQRVEASETFRLIAENADRFKARREREEFPLSLKAFQSDVAAQKKESERFRDIRKTIDGMEVSFLSADMDYIYEDETRTQRFETWQKNLRKDIHLYETIQIMQDMN